MVRTVNVLKMQKNLGRLLEQVEAKGDRYVVEQAGRPTARLPPLAFPTDGALLAERARRRRS